MVVVDATIPELEVAPIEHDLPRALVRQIETNMGYETQHRIPAICRGGCDAASPCLLATNFRGEFISSFASFLDVFFGKKTGHTVSYPGHGTFKAVEYKDPLQRKHIKWVTTAARRAAKEKKSAVFAGIAKGCPPIQGIKSRPKDMTRREYRAAREAEAEEAMYEECFGSMTTEDFICADRPDNLTLPAPEVVVPPATTSEVEAVSTVWVAEHTPRWWRVLNWPPFHLIPRPQKVERTMAATCAPFRPKKECSALKEFVAAYSSHADKPSLEDTTPEKEDFDAWMPVRGDYLFDGNSAEAQGELRYILERWEQLKMKMDDEEGRDDDELLTEFRRARKVATVEEELKRIEQAKACSTPLGFISAADAAWARSTPVVARTGTPTVPQDRGRYPWVTYLLGRGDLNSAVYKTVASAREHYVRGEWESWRFGANKHNPESDPRPHKKRKERPLPDLGMYPRLTYFFRRWKTQDQHAKWRDQRVQQKELEKKKLIPVEPVTPGYGILAVEGQWEYAIGEIPSITYGVTDQVRPDRPVYSKLREYFTRGRTGCALHINEPGSAFLRNPKIHTTSGPKLRRRGLIALARTNGYCYLRGFEAKFWRSAVLFFGANPTMSSLLQKGWHYSYDVSGDTAHAHRFGQYVTVHPAHHSLRVGSAQWWQKQAHDWQAIAERANTNAALMSDQLTEARQEIARLRAEKKDGDENTHVLLDLKESLDKAFPEIKSHATTKDTIDFFNAMRAEVTESRGKLGYADAVRKGFSHQTGFGGQTTLPPAQHKSCESVDAAHKKEVADLNATCAAQDAQLKAAELTAASATVYAKTQREQLQLYRDKLASKAKTLSLREKICLPVERPSFFWRSIMRYKVAINIPGGWFGHTGGWTVSGVPAFRSGYKYYQNLSREQQKRGGRLTVQGFERLLSVCNPKKRRQILKNLNITETEIAEEFRLARNSSMADIELNPGPPNSVHNSPRSLTEKVLRRMANDYADRDWNLQSHEGRASQYWKTDFIFEGIYQFGDGTIHSHEYGRSRESKQVYQVDIVPNPQLLDDLSQDITLFSTQFVVATKDYPAGTCFCVSTFPGVQVPGMVSLQLWWPRDELNEYGVVVPLPPYLRSKLGSAKARLLPFAHGNPDHMFYVTNGRHEDENWPDLRPLVTKEHPIWSVCPGFEHPGMENLCGYGGLVPIQHLWMCYCLTHEAYGADEVIMLSILRVHTSSPKGIGKRTVWHNITPFTNMAVDFYDHHNGEVEHVDRMSMHSILERNARLKDVYEPLPALTTLKPLGILISGGGRPLLKRAQPSLTRLQAVDVAFKEATEKSKNKLSSLFTKSFTFTNLDHLSGRRSLKDQSISLNLKIKENIGRFSDATAGRTQSFVPFGDSGRETSSDKSQTTYDRTIYYVKERWLGYYLCIALVLTTSWQRRALWLCLRMLAPVILHFGTHIYASFGWIWTLIFGLYILSLGLPRTCRVISTFAANRVPNDVLPRCEGFAYTEGTTPHSELYKPSETFLIASIGTWGDLMPVRYYARLATALGVNTHIAHQPVTKDELACLDNGHITFSLLLKYAFLFVSETYGYKKVLTTQMTPVLGGDSISFSFTKRYRNRMNFGPSLIGRVQSYATDLFRPTFVVSCFGDGNLPRPVSEHALLVKRKNNNTGKTGRAIGSAPANWEQWQHIENVPNGDHQEIMRDYSRIVVNGHGALSVAVACGAEPIVANPTLDRDIHTMPKLTDFSQPTAAPFVGMLVASGFNVQLPLYYKVWAALSYYARHAETTLSSLPRLTLGFILLYSHFASYTWLILAFTVSIPGGFSLLSRVPHVRAFRSFIVLLSHMPLVLVVSGWFQPLLFFTLQLYLAPYIVRDVLTFCRKEGTWLVIEKQPGVPWPWGHTLLYSETYDEVYEGLFELEQGQAQPFRFQKSPKDFSKEQARLWIPLPFNDAVLHHELKSKSAAYGATHNCNTVLLPPLLSTGLVAYFIFAVEILGSASLLGFATAALSLLDRISPSTRAEMKIALRFADRAENPEKNTTNDTEGGTDQTRKVEEEQINNDFDDDDEFMRNPDFDAKSAWSVTVDLCTEALIRSGLSEAEAVELVASAVDRQLEECVELQVAQPPRTNDDPALRPYWKITDKIRKWLRHANVPPGTIDLVNWLLTRAEKHYNLWRPILSLLFVIAQHIKTATEFCFKKLSKWIRRLISYWYDDLPTRDPKAVWLIQEWMDPVDLSPLGRWVQTMSTVKRQERLSYMEDFDFYAALLKHYGKKNDVPQAVLDKIGNPSFTRTVRGKPVMSREEAAYNGFSEDDYVWIAEWQERVDWLVGKEGIPPASDSFWRGYLHPEEVQRSCDRYTQPLYKMDSEQRILADQIIEEMIARFPGIFLNKQIVDPDAAMRYMMRSSVKGTALGVGMTEYGLKTKEDMRTTGMSKAIVEAVRGAYTNGTAIPMFFHMKSKEQPVKQNIDKMIRTISAQSVPSIVYDLVVSVDNMKTSAFALGNLGGVPLDFRFRKVFNDLLIQAGGPRGKGGYILKDAHAYDSTIPELGAHVATGLRKAGFDWHPNKGAIHSHIETHKDNLNNSWLVKVSLDQTKTKTYVVVDNDSDAHYLSTQYPMHFTTNTEEPSQKSQKIILLTPENHKTLQKQDPWLNYAGSFFTSNVDHKGLQNTPFLSKTSSRELRDHYLLKIARYPRAAEHLSNIVEKNRGGGTGSSDTSWWNGMTYLGICIASYCIAFGKTPKDYFEEVKQFNMGDDSGEATKTAWTAEKRMAFKQAAASLGVELDVDFTRNIEEVQIIGMMARYPTLQDSQTIRDWQRWTQARTEIDPETKQVIKYAGELHKSPELVIYNQGDQAVMRRTALTAFKSTQERWRWTSINGALGIANLFAFQPRYYNIALSMYLEDAAALCAMHGIQSRPVVRTDEDGYPYVHWVGFSETNHQIAATKDLAKTLGLPHFLNLETRDLDRQMYDRKLTMHQKLTLRQAHLYNRLTKTGLQFPSYRQVVTNWMKTGSIKQKNLETSTFGTYLHKWHSDLPWDQKAMELLQYATKVTDTIIPNDLKRFIPSVPGLSPSLPWSPPKDILSWALAGALDVYDAKTLSAYSRESPFADCMSPGDWATTEGQDPAILEQFKEYPKQFYKAIFLWSCVGYMLVGFVLEPLIYRMPILGLIYAFFLFTQFKMTKWYSLLNWLYFCGRMRSSREISSLQLRDPFVALKRASVWLAWITLEYTDYAPAWILMPFVWVFELFADLVESCARLVRQYLLVKWVQARYGDNSAVSQNNPWDQYVMAIHEAIEDKNDVIITAGTGTGKSTFLQLSIQAARNDGICPRFGDRTVICQPRHVLVDNLKLPEGCTSQILEGNTPIDNSVTHYIGTYKHLCNRLTAGQFDDPENTLIVCDEFHEASVEMIDLIDEIMKVRNGTSVGFKNQKIPMAFPILFLSATPVPLSLISHAPIIRPDIPMRNRRTTHIRDGADVMDNILWARENFPEYADSILAVVPTVEECMNISQHMASLGITTDVCHRNARNPDPTVSIIVATSIVNAGITLPGRDLVVSSGKRIAIHRGQFVHPFPDTDPDFETQLDGRVGRGNRAGIIVKPSNAGMGEKPIEYGAGLFYQKKVIADFHRLPQLETVQDAYFKEEPCFSVDRSLPNPIRKGLAFIHLCQLMGISQTTHGDNPTWRQVYRMKFIKKEPLPEEYEYIDRVMSNKDTSPIAGFDLILQYLGSGHVHYKINGKRDSRGVIVPLGGTWQTPTPPEHKYVIHETTTEAQGYEELMKAKERKIKSHLAKILNAAMNSVKSDLKPHQARKALERVTKEIGRAKQELVTPSDASLDAREHHGKPHEFKAKQKPKTVAESPKTQESLGGSIGSRSLSPLAEPFTPSTPTGSNYEVTTPMITEANLLNDSPFTLDSYY